MDKLERQGIIRLVNTLGADITISLQPHQPLSRSDTARLRDRLEHVATWPADSLTTPATIAIVMPPAWPKNQRSMLRTTLAQSGVEVHDETAWISGDAGRLEQQHAIRASNARWVLMVGGDGVGLWRGDAQMRQLVGGVYPAVIGHHTYLLGVIESPGAVLRGTIDPKQWRLRVARYVDLIREPMEDVDKLTWRCTFWNRERERTCTEAAFAWDELGLPWCRWHVNQGMTKGRNQGKAGRERGNRELQETLL